MPHSRYRIPLLVTSLLLASAFSACGGEVLEVIQAPTATPRAVATEPQTEGEATQEATVAASNTPIPTIVELQPTDTPPPPPRTPTPRPTSTLVPTPTPQAESSVEEATPEPTPPPAPQVTDIMVEIPDGPFILGNNNSHPSEAPEQEMVLPAYSIDIFEVTNEDFAAFVAGSGYTTFRERDESPQNWRWAFREGRERHPVVFVTFDDAQAFCEWAGKRLPTEFEWEKAARGPDHSLFPWGSAYDPTMLNGRDSGLRKTTVVGSYPENGYGLFDMAGNVREWVDSPYVSYPGATYQDPFYSEDYRGLRGGGWFDEEELVLSTNRNGGDPVITANDDIGFRCAR